MIAISGIGLVLSERSGRDVETLSMLRGDAVDELLHSGTLYTLATLKSARPLKWETLRDVVIDKKYF
uniref:Transcriptional regulator n=1 Tax=Angiostrongylus cantonensis TaxID=6313 RepID=A0A0K0DBI0_ANGCA